MTLKDFLLYIMIRFKMRLSCEFHLASFNFSGVRHGSAIPHGTKRFWRKVIKLNWDGEDSIKYFVRRKLLSKKKFLSTSILKHN